MQHETRIRFWAFENIRPIALILLVMLATRFLPSPFAVLVADDWANLARSQFYANYADAAIAGLKDPNRPLSMAAVEIAFRYFGTDRLPWTLIAILGNAALLVGIWGLALELSGRRDIALLTGIIVAVLPNLTETHLWSTQVLNEVCCALVPYVWSAYAWLRWTKKGSLVHLFAAALAYAVGLFSYEAGVLLPAAYSLLVIRAFAARRLMGLIPFALVVAAYVVWRSTNALGLNDVWHYPPHMQVGITFAGIVWNAKEIVHWWIGDYFWGSLLNGLIGFSMLKTSVRWMLVALNILLLGSIVVYLRRHTSAVETTEPFRPLYQWGFILAWILCTLAIPLVSYTASRLMVLPAIGIALGLGRLLTCANSPVGATIAALLFVLSGASTQGTSENYRQAGMLNQRLYAALRQTRDEWLRKDVLLFDTRELRHRLTRGVLRPLGADPTTWATYLNVPLHRGFLFVGMAQLAAGSQYPQVHILHDVENMAHREDEALIWHARYDASIAYTTKWSRVYSMDVWKAGQHEIGSARQ
jgi:hypothetical protein